MSRDEREPVVKQAAEPKTSGSASRRIKREKHTVTLMIQLYCRDHHGGPLCAECSTLLAYALARVETCPFGADKPVCSRCLVHCYRPALRERIREVMRYAGPRMTRHHPYLALRHLLDRRKPPQARDQDRPGSVSNRRCPGTKNHEAPPGDKPGADFSQPR